MSQTAIYHHTPSRVERRSWATVFRFLFRHTSFSHQRSISHHTAALHLCLYSLCQFLLDGRLQAFRLRHAPVPRLALSISADQELFLSTQHLQVSKDPFLIHLLSHTKTRKREKRDTAAGMPAPPKQKPKKEEGKKLTLKIPLDPPQPQQPWPLLLHPLPHRLRLVPVHLRLAEHRKRDAVIQLAKLLNLVVAARVLPAELVAREAEDDEVGAVRGRGADGFVEFFKAGELRGEAAFRGRVDDEDDFVLE